jgi:nitric oxide reductase NorD protein
MEEQVGALWHRLITRASERRYPEAAVRLEDMAVTLGIVLPRPGRRCRPGGQGRGRLAPTAPDAACWRASPGSGNRMALAWRDDRALMLPPVIDRFPEPGLNRDLYLWLAALATGEAQEGRRLADR